MLLRIVVCLLVGTSLAAADELKLSIRTDFPGGNVLVVKNEGATVELAPDLRGGRPWFYWHFEAAASQPGLVKFVIGGVPQTVGVRGPAVSVDAGENWRWLGVEQVEYASPPGSGGPNKRDAFTYDFTADRLTVRFAVAIPYLQRNLDDFLRKHAGNGHLDKTMLTRSTQGRSVELLRIGEPGGEKQSVLMTARHHACESMASYALEGFIAEAMSDSPAGKEFRQRYVLFAVPIMDKDGVELGDQGKNRNPHDHNRDYGEGSIYPEVQAVQELGRAQQVRLALDWHCPALRGEVHEVFYFDGLSLPHVTANVNELIAWMKEEIPLVVGAPHNFMKKPAAEQPTRGMPFSFYWAYQPGNLVAATLEVPYTQPGYPLDPALAREYGASVLRAWVRTKFVANADESARSGAAFADLAALRTKFQQSFRSQPAVAEQAATALVEDKSSGLHRVEGYLQLATLKLTQKKYADALRHAEAAAGDSQASRHQHNSAMALRVQNVAAEPGANVEALEAQLEPYLAIAYAAPEQRYKVLDVASDFFRDRKQYPRALALAEQQPPVAGRYEKGRTFNRIAALHDLLGQKDRAAAVRETSIATLRKQLDPVPVGIFGAQMANDLFEALQAQPTATLAERRAAAQMVLDHKVAPAAMKESVRKALAAIESTSGK